MLYWKKSTAYGYIWKYKEKQSDDQIIINTEIIINIEDFKPINNYPNYKINKKGVVINSKNLVMKQVLNMGKYYAICLLNTEGKRQLVPIHRLVALTFIPNSNNYDVVNHIDKNKLNNNVENLEWTTIAGNTKHACGRKINMLDIKTNEILKTFESIKDAYVYLGKKYYDRKIANICNGNSKLFAGYNWKWV
jgi:hypothetical protein